MTHGISHRIDGAMHECIDACLECHRACHATAAYGLEQGGRRAEARRLTLLLDCAEICQTGRRHRPPGPALRDRADAHPRARRQVTQVRCTQHERP